MAGGRPGHTGDNVFQERRKKSSLQVKSGVGGSYLIMHDTVCAPIELSCTNYSTLDRQGQTRSKEMHEKCLIQQTVWTLSIVIICAIITQIHESNRNKSGIGPHCCPCSNLIPMVRDL